uniref:Plastocyanin-like domain-containing protein n=1 Tax=Vitis vinifera TaxID=29760 RepID=A5AF60_VITVI|nr:hypothetical protein VITISV_006773 [Vitis vinifera]
MGVYDDKLCKGYGMVWLTRIHGYGMRKVDEVGWRRRWAQVGNGHGGHRGVMVEDTTSSFMDSPIAVDNMTTIATVQYSGTLSSTLTTITNPPAQNVTLVATKFIVSLRSLNPKKYPARVPLTIDHSLLFTVGLRINPCAICVNGGKVMANINNVTFVMSTTALLQAHYFKMKGIGIQLYRLVSPIRHRGLGNYNPKKNLKNFNLVDPIERNTVVVPFGGWIAIRFIADNPGVSFMHCHLEVHTTWGMKMAKAPMNQFYYPQVTFPNANTKTSKQEA